MTESPLDVAVSWGKEAVDRGCFAFALLLAKKDSPPQTGWAFYNLY